MHLILERLLTTPLTVGIVTLVFVFAKWTPNCQLSIHIRALSYH